MTATGPRRLAWPDGGSFLDQPMMVVELFKAFHWAVVSEMEAERMRG